MAIYNTRLHSQSECSDVIWTALRIFLTLIELVQTQALTKYKLTLHGASYLVELHFFLVLFGYQQCSCSLIIVICKFQSKIKVENTSFRLKDNSKRTCFNEEYVIYVFLAKQVIGIINFEPQEDRILSIECRMLIK